MPPSVPRGERALQVRHRAARLHGLLHHGTGGHPHDLTTLRREVDLPRHRDTRLRGPRPPRLHHSFSHHLLRLILRAPAREGRVHLRGTDHLSQALTRASTSAPRHIAPSKWPPRLEDSLASLGIRVAGLQQTARRGFGLAWRLSHHVVEPFAPCLDPLHSNFIDLNLLFTWPVAPADIRWPSLVPAPWR